MATILTSTIITNTQQAVADYSTQADNLFNNSLVPLLSNLRSNNFIGDGSEGYQNYFDSHVMPALVDNLTGPNSIMAGLRNMLDDIGSQLLDNADPKIGELNRNPTGGGEG